MISEDEKQTVLFIALKGDDSDKARALQHFSLYKEKLQHALTPNEREKLEALIEQCKK